MILLPAPRVLAFPAPESKSRLDRLWSEWWVSDPSRELDASTLRARKAYSETGSQ
jgi:hypothetical protein